MDRGGRWLHPGGARGPLAGEGLSRHGPLWRLWFCSTASGKTKTSGAGRLAYEQLKALPLHWIEASEPLLEQAASIKARYALSLADAWIAAAAQQVGATLLHKDPAFRAIAALSQEWLS